MSSWFIGPAYSVRVLLSICFFVCLVFSLPGCQQLHLKYIFYTLQWLEIYKNQGPYLLKKAQKLQLVFGFFEKFHHLSVLCMVFDKSSCNFCFLIANLSHYSEKFLILIYYPKMFSFNQNQLVLVTHTKL